MQGRPEIHQAIAALQRLSELFALRRRQLARECELSLEQWRLLEEIAGEDFMPSLFARRRACTPAAVSRGLRSLQERGLASATVAESDGRQRVYRLTSQGRRLLHRLRSGRERAIAAVWERFDAQALRGFVAFAEELSDHLEAYARRRSEGSPSARERAASASR